MTGDRQMHVARSLLTALAVTVASPSHGGHLVPSTARSGDAPIKPAPIKKGPTFSSIGELTPPDQVQSELRGARVADPRVCPASFYTQSAGGFCTASMVGDRVLLTAAHCVENGSAISLIKNGKTFEATCEQAPDYRKGGSPDATADYALCALTDPIPGVPAERVNARATALKVGSEILLTGFGCVTGSGNGGNDGVYRIGETTIRSLPSGTSSYLPTSGGAALCFGDSGGPAFLIGPGDERTQVSVNSRVENNGQGGTDLGPKSFLSSLTSRRGSAFLSEWSSRKGLRICGLDPLATTCRP